MGWDLWIVALLVCTGSNSPAVTVPYAQGAAVGIVSVPGSLGTTSLLDEDVVTPNGLAQVSATVGSASQGITATVNATGNAGYGVLSASAFISYNVTGAPALAYDAGEGSFADLITVNFAPWEGRPGLMYVNYTLDGSNTSTGSAQAFAFVDAGGGTLSQYWTQYYLSSTAGTFSLPAPLHFTYGQPFDLYFALDANAGSLTANPLGTSGAVGTASANSDFFNTLVLSGLIPTDINGNVAIGAQFSSASGTQYSTDGVVPEPATFGLFFISVCGGLIAHRKSEFLSLFLR